MAAKTIALSEASQRLRVPYRRLYDLVIGGQVPATRQGARWRITEIHLPAIAEKCGVNWPPEKETGEQR